MQIKRDCLELKVFAIFREHFFRNGRMGSGHSEASASGCIVSAEPKRGSVSVSGSVSVTHGNLYKVELIAAVALSIFSQMTEMAALFIGIGGFGLVVGLGQFVMNLAPSLQINKKLG